MSDLISNNNTTDPSSLKIGLDINGKGYFLGFYDIGTGLISDKLDGASNQVGLFAAPRGMASPESILPVSLKHNFNFHVSFLPVVQNWFGRNGAQLGDQPALPYEAGLEEILNSLPAGESTGWFIGTRDMLLQQAKIFEHLQQQALFTNREIKDDEGDAVTDSYDALSPNEAAITLESVPFLSCSEHFNLRGKIGICYFLQQRVDWTSKGAENQGKGRVRPVFAERYTPAPTHP